MSSPRNVRSQPRNNDRSSSIVGTPSRRQRSSELEVPVNGTPQRSQPSSELGSSQYVNGNSSRRGRLNNASASGRIHPPSEQEIIPPSEGYATPRPVNSSPFHPNIGESDFLSSPINYGPPSSIGSVSSVTRGTPHRPRPDLGGGSQRFRQLNPDRNSQLENGHSSQVQSSEADGTNELVIWGTNVSVTKCKHKFRRFVEEFVNATPAEDERTDGMDETLPFYLQKLEEIKIMEEPYLNLNCAHLESFDAEFYKQLVTYPSEVVPTLDLAISEIFFEKYPAIVLSHQIQVRPFNSKSTKSMRSLDPQDIDQLITISGMVIRTSNLIPEVSEVFFRCVNCHSSTTVKVEKGHIAEPTLCTNCSTNHCFQVIHNRSEFSDKQIVKLQESPDDIPAGQTPASVNILCYYKLVDNVQAGERVTVTGIYRAIPVQRNPRMSNVMSVFRTYIDVVHFRKVDSNRLHSNEDGKQHKFSPERIELLKQLSVRDDIYERLATALAPSIFGNLDVKKGILLQLFGGTRKTSVNTGRGKMRSEMNILLCGDPGTSKSQLLSYVYDLVPRSQYTSGKGSSAVGLTAYVMKDPETNQLVLQTGALVLADNGICCIDEFDKMDDSTRSVLHEVMEQQTLSIAKAGIICQLNARTSILAAANPCESQWNPKKTVIENVQLPHSLLSRFDLIFLMLDPHDEAYDKKLAHHLVSLYHKKKELNEEENMELDILKDYIAYAKEHIVPKISDAAYHQLIEQYVEMRKVGSHRGRISAYPRQLESLIRLAEAHAKMRLSEHVEVSDVIEAYRLYMEALKAVVTDPKTGSVDFDILTTGQSSSHRQMVENYTKMLKLIISDKVKERSTGISFSYGELLSDFNSQHSDQPLEYHIYDQVLKMLEQQNVLKEIERKKNLYLNISSLWK